MLTFSLNSERREFDVVEVADESITSSYGADCEAGRTYGASARQYLIERGNVPMFVALLTDVAARPAGDGFRVGFLTDIAVALARD